MLFNSGRAVKRAGDWLVPSFVRKRDDDDDAFLVKLYDCGPAVSVPKASAKAVAVAELKSSRSVTDDELLGVVVVVVEPSVD